MPNEHFDEAQYKQLDRIEVKLAELEVKVNAAVTSSEKIRKYLMWTAIITAAVIILPLLILPLLLPAFLSSVALPTGF